MLNFGLAESLAILVPLSYGGVFLYLGHINKKVGGLCERVEKLGDGCFERHAKLERELGQNEMIEKALHERVDNLENKVNQVI